MYIKSILRKLKRMTTRNLKCIDGRLVKPGRVNLEWWHQRENIGDGISPVICEYMLSRKGLSLDSKAKKTCHLMAVGSICGAGGMDATVWGSGIHHRSLQEHILSYKDTRKLDVRAVRGPVTERFLNENGISCPEIYGDPAVIMPLIYAPKIQKKCYPVSVVLHISQKENKKPAEEIHQIDIESNDYKHFIDELLSSEKVISSSLHGIILAESYGIPAVFLCEGIEDQMMKYKDWYEATGRAEFRYAKNLEQAMEMDPMPIPELSDLRQKLMAAFPYDLWEEK